VNGPGRGSARAAAAIGAAAVPFALALGIACAFAAVGAGTAQQPATACGTAPVQAGQSAGGVALSPAQMNDAQVIYDVSASLRLPQRAAVIAEATSMQESTLLDLPSGTSDSLGLFQQRPSMGWGTPAEIMQPAYAAAKFYAALVQVPGWQSLPLTVAAQAVQRSAYPDAYAKWEPLGDALAATFSGQAGNCLTDNGGGVPVSGIPACQRASPCHPAPRPRSSPPSPTQPPRSASHTSGPRLALPATTAPAWS
jgi:hypothetical protein